MSESLSAIRLVFSNLPESLAGNQESSKSVMSASICEIENENCESIADKIKNPDQYLCSNKISDIYKIPNNNLNTISIDNSRVDVHLALGLLSIKDSKFSVSVNLDGIENHLEIRIKSKKIKSLSKVGVDY
jgi:hypothetical protein